MGAVGDMETIVFRRLYNGRNDIKIHSESGGGCRKIVYIRH